MPKQKMDDWVENNQVINKCDFFGLVGEVAFHIFTRQFIVFYRDAAVCSEYVCEDQWS